MTAPFPIVLVSDWEIRLIQIVQAGALTFKYLENETETDNQAHRSPNYVLHPEAMRKLARLLMQAADRLEAG